jgi:hypothetical protein
MIKAFKRWLAKAVHEGLGEQSKNIAQPSRLDDMMMDAGVAFIVFQIDNGFVVRTINRHNAMIGNRNPGFVYCADHQAIADYLISSAMKDKLGVQSDMFEKEKQAAQHQYASNKLTAHSDLADALLQPRGEVAAQPRI